MSSEATQRIYFFGGDGAEGSGSMRSLLGGKGANLAEMARIGLPVPPGFTISTEVCLAYHDQGGLPEGLMEEVRAAMARLEEVSGKRFGDPERPLLVSVRSGAAVSMPGMMDTVLNLGLNPEIREGLERLSGAPRFARDAHRRLIQMFGNVVRDVPAAHFEAALDRIKSAAGAASDTELDVPRLDELIAAYHAVYLEGVGEPFPEDPWAQLEAAVAAVFSSWNLPRAITYRRQNRIPHDLGTAVNVQSMVYGNLGDGCATGVAFTRCTATGEPRFNGEYLPNAQGEDVVAGTRTPLPLGAERAAALGLAGRALEETFPEPYAELCELGGKLEAHYGDVQDLEFTIEHGHLYLLQTRTAKRTGRAWVQTAVDMVEEGRIDRREAVLRVPAGQLAELLSPTVDPRSAEATEAAGRLLARGLEAGPGAAMGRIAFTADEAEARAEAGESIILVRDETTPDDIHGMIAAAGVLTARGGMTSHAAVVARGMGKPCIVGCSALSLDAGGRALRVGGRTLGPEEWITLDGTTGKIYEGELAIVPSEVVQVLVEHTLTPEEAPLYQCFQKLMTWADQLRGLRVRTNADNPHDSTVAVALGAEGIGLCRTEHMFFGADRILAMRRMILAGSVAEREEALAALEPMQTEDFRGIFRVMGSRPVTIRTLDPPLHEFLPHGEAEIADLAAHLGVSPGAVSRRVHGLREANPMLGHRGCRLGILHPEITRMQARAILRASLDVGKEGVAVRPEIMIPLIGHVRELEEQKRLVLEEAERIFAERGSRVDFLVGTMIEVPRAALTAGEVAAEAAFFSFGTNDLTQMTLGLSRDDAGSFLPEYARRGIYEVDPFVSVDVRGVGKLMEMAVSQGRGVRPDLKVGICGEHGGDPASVSFCDGLGLDYVSCSPYRVPVARLAAAQAALRASNTAEVA